MRCSSSWVGWLSLVPSWRGECGAWAVLGGRFCCQEGPCPHHPSETPLSKHMLQTLARRLALQHSPALMCALSLPGGAAGVL